MTGRRIFGRRATQLLASVSATCLLMGQIAPAYAQGGLPTGGNVVAGTAQIGDGSAGRLEINQSSENAIINWNGFSVGQGQSVQINNGTGATLNRVTGAERSAIDGALNGTGSVFVINPNGLIVGKTGVVKTGGNFVASTHDITNEDFMNGGDATFASDSDASIENFGSISSVSGDVMLISRTIRNEGTIDAANGTAGLAAGQEVLLRDQSFEGGKLMVRVGGAEDEVTTNGTIEAANVELRAAGGNIFALAGNNDGVISAKGVTEKDGRIFLTAGDTGRIGVDQKIAASAGADGGEIAVEGGFISLGGEIRADGDDGGKVTIQGSAVSLADTVSAVGTAGDGGSVDIVSLGNSLVFDTAKVDASGSENGGSIRHLTGADLTHSGAYLADGEKADGGKIDIGGGATKLLSATFSANGGADGGQVRIGGEYQGGKGLEVDELANTQRLAVSTGTKITADGGVAGGTGDGGTVILWADENATVLGDISARPGVNAGEGGFIEVSAGTEIKILSDNITAGGGTVLFDPRNIFIEDASEVDQSSFILGNEFSSSVNLASTLGAGDQFGSAVAIDGTQLAVGAPRDNGRFGDLPNTGAVYLFTFNNPDFSGGRLNAIIGKGYFGGNNFQPENLGRGDRFGASVALDTGRLVVGATGDDGFRNQVAESGAAYLFRFDVGGFTNITTRRIFGAGYPGSLSRSVNNDAFDRFGSSVAIDGSTLAIGALGDDGALNGGSDLGRVDIFELSPSEAVLVSQIGAGYQDNTTFIPASKGRPARTILNFSGFDIPLRNGDEFGSALALDDGLLFVGAPGADGAFENRINSGAVHQFQFNDDFTEVTNVGRLAVGNIGLYDVNMDGLDANDRFGTSIAFDGDRLAIGAIGDDGINNHRSNSGAVHLFDVPGGNTSQIKFDSMVGRYNDESGTGKESTVVADLDVNDFFGSAVALDGSRLIVGARNDDGVNNSTQDIGKVYTFVLKDDEQTALNQTNIIGNGHFADGTGLPVAADDRFGSSVSIDQGRIVIGATGDDGASDLARDTGAVYLYSGGFQGLGDLRLQGVIGSGYRGGRNVDVAGLQTGDRFGSSVSLDGARLAVGAQGDDGDLNTSTDTGAVYLFSFSNSLFSDGQLNRTLRSSGQRSQANFGAGVALQDNQLFVGAPGDGLGGSASFYTLSFSSFTPQAFADVTKRGSIDRTNFALDNGDAFGVSLDFDGSRLLVGAPGDDGIGNRFLNSGAVHAFTFGVNAATTKLGATLGKTHIGTFGLGYLGPDNINVEGLQAGDQFGRSVALDGANALVGAPADDGPGNQFTTSNTGAVYHIAFPDADLKNGSVVGVIGAGYDGLSQSGRPNTAVKGLRAGDAFGSAVALDGGQAAIGAISSDGANGNRSASGSVRVFDLERSSTARVIGRSTLGKGYQSPALTTNLGAGDEFGSALSLDGNRFAIGAPGDDGLVNGQADVGAVYLYSFDSTAFDGLTLQSTIGAGYFGGKNINVGNLEAGDRFGSSVSLDQNRLAIGAQNDDGAFNSETASGAVYLFRFSDEDFANGRLMATLGDGYNSGNSKSVGLDRGDAFGSAVALDGNRLAIGAAGDDGRGNLSAESGAVYLYTFDTSNFLNLTESEHRIGSNYNVRTNTKGTPTFKGVSVDGVRAGDRFGASVALDGDKLAVGASLNDGRGFAGRLGPINSGAVFLMKLADENPLGEAKLVGRIGSGWSGRINTVRQEESSLNLNLDAGDGFGGSLALDGNTLLVGAPSADGFGNPRAGSGEAYRFTFAGDDYRGVELTGRYGALYGATLNSGGRAQHFNTGIGDRFGAAVALDGKRMMFGAPGDDGAGNSTTNSGRVFFASNEAQAFNGDPIASGQQGLSSGEDVTITTERLERMMQNGDDVVLLANNVISLRGQLRVRDPLNKGIGDLTMIAGRSIFIGHDITLDGSNVTMLANATEADGIVASDRLPGLGHIILRPDADVRTGATGTVNMRIGSGVPGALRGRLILQGNNTIGGREVSIPLDALELGDGSTFTIFDASGVPFSGEPVQVQEYGTGPSNGNAETGEQCDDLDCATFDTSALTE